MKLFNQVLEKLVSSRSAKQRARIGDILARRPVAIEYRGRALKLSAQSSGAYKRAKRLISKEPGTVGWIEAIPEGSVFWDIGANVGVYTLLAAANGHRVVAFEPAANNFATLCANVELNEFAQVDCLAVGISDSLGVDHLEISQFSSGESFSFTGKPHRPYGHRQASILVTPTFAIERLKLPAPSHVKIDVPGYSWNVVKGLTPFFGSADLRQVQIETRPSGKSGRALIAYFAEHDFKVKAVHGDPGEVLFERVT